MKTEVMKHSDEEGNKMVTVIRKSISQYHKGVFPVLCYNLGLTKIVAQNTLANGKQFIIKIPDGQTFVNFVDFDKLDDIGFYPNKLRLEACSRFAFITLDQKTIHNPMYNIYFLLVDPYYEDT